MRGRATDRVNRGRLDPKNLFDWQATNPEDRLTTPLVREGENPVEASRKEAMDRVVERSKRKHRSRSRFYSTGQPFLEEYYTLGVIHTAGIGTPHMDGQRPAVR